MLEIESLLGRSIRGHHLPANPCLFFFNRPRAELFEEAADAGEAAG